MKIFYVLLSCAILGVANAGPLGKYQEPSQFSEPLIRQQAVPAIDKQALERAVKLNEEKRKKQLFYADFENKVRALNDTEKQQWLVEYRKRLNTASSRETMNKQEVDHYARLVAIIQKNQ